MRCQAVIKVKGEMRLRRGRGFYRHYESRQCSRKACIEGGLCTQHSKMSDWKVDRMK